MRKVSDMSTYQRLDGLLQLLHVNVVAFPLLYILPFLDFRRSRATCVSRCDHLSA